MLDLMRDYAPSRPVPMAECNVRADDTYNRDPKEDIQKGIEYVFELNEKLKKLHPLANAIVTRMLKTGY